MAYISFQPSDFFSTLLWTGNSPSTQALTGAGFQPDFVWVKKRSSAAAHCLTDSVRGVTKTLFSNDTIAEATRTGGLTVFGSDGYTVGADGDFNGGSATFVGWNWKAGGAGSANTDGDIDSTVSVNTTAGFSIVKYTGTGSAQTVGHGLGVAPNMIILKESTSTSQWQVTNDYLGWTKRLNLDDNSIADTTSTIWNDTAPTSSVFSIGTSGAVTEIGETYVAYCFTSKKGYSRFGSYTGNGNADGTFVYTGFRPAWLMIKRIASADNWYMFDKDRLGFNVDNEQLYADTTADEATVELLDICSNGFKLRHAEAAVNNTSEIYIYAAFAEFPIVSSNNTPGLAR